MISVSWDTAPGWPTTRCSTVPTTTQCSWYMYRPCFNINVSTFTQPKAVVFPCLSSPVSCQYQAMMFHFQRVSSVSDFTILSTYICPSARLFCVVFPKWYPPSTPAYAMMTVWGNLHSAVFSPDSSHTPYVCLTPGSISGSVAKYKCTAPLDKSWQTIYNHKSDW